MVFTFSIWSAGPNELPQIRHSIASFGYFLRLIFWGVTQNKYRFYFGLIFELLQLLASQHTCLGNTFKMKEHLTEGNIWVFIPLYIVIIGMHMVWENLINYFGCFTYKYLKSKALWSCILIIMQRRNDLFYVLDGDKNDHNAFSIFMKSFFHGRWISHQFYIILIIILVGIYYSGLAGIQQQMPTNLWFTGLGNESKYAYIDLSECTEKWFNTLIQMNAS